MNPVKPPRCAHAYNVPKWRDLRPRLIGKMQSARLTKCFGQIGTVSCLLLAILQATTLAQQQGLSAAKGPGHPTFSFVREKQALEIICRDGFQDFMMNPCTDLDRPAERDKAVRLYGDATGEIAGRLGITVERTRELIGILTNVNMAKRFATGEFKDSDCPAPDNDPPISEAEEVKARQTTCELLQVLRGSNPPSGRIEQLSTKAEFQFSRTMCVSPLRAHRILVHVRNEFLAAKVDCAASLALVGWYLMVPPHTGGQSAPLSQWITSHQPYDTSAKCEQARADFIDLMKRPRCCQIATSRGRWNAK